MGDGAWALLLALHCKGCGSAFAICVSCFRGQVYCGARCRAEARREQHRQANRKYQKSLAGLTRHRERQKRWRGAQVAVTDTATGAEVEPPRTVYERERTRWPATADDDQPRCSVCRRIGTYDDDWFVEAGADRGA